MKKAAQDQLFVRESEDVMRDFAALDSEVWALEVDHDAHGKYRESTAKTSGGK